MVAVEEAMGVKVELRTNPLPKGRANRRIVVGAIFAFINVDFYLYFLSDRTRVRLPVGREEVVGPAVRRATWRGATSASRSRTRWV